MLYLVKFFEYNKNNMESQKIEQRRLTFTLLGFALIFFLMPFTEIRPLPFHLTAFVLTLVLFLSARILPVSSKYKWFLIILSVLALCFDLLLLITFHPLLEFFLILSSHGIYTVCLGACVWLLVRNLASTEHNPKSLLKSGICGYLLLGFFWMEIYTFISALNPSIFSGVPVHNVSFFYFSFFALSFLTGQGTFAACHPVAYHLVGLEALTGQAFLFFFIARLAILSYSYEARR